MDVAKAHGTRRQGKGQTERVGGQGRHAFQCRGEQPASVHAVRRPVAWWAMTCSLRVLLLVRFVVNT